MVWVASTCSCNYLCKRKAEGEGKGDLLIDRRKRCTSEEEIGVIKLKAKECRESPEAGRSKEWTQPQGGFGSVMLISSFQSLELRENNLLLF